MKKYLIYFIWKNIAIVSFMIHILVNKAMITQVVIISLILACCHLLSCIVTIKKTTNIKSLTILGIEIIILLMGGFLESLPLISIVMLEGLDLVMKDKKKPLFLSIIILMNYMLCENVNQLIEIIIILSGFLLTNYLNDKLLYYKEIITEDNAIKIHQQEEIRKLKEHGKTMKEVAILEERNRFSGRIHDKLGHSISGSIILLEATSLIFDSQPTKAKDNIKRVVENLSEGVNDIRKALREERPKLPILNLAELKETLERFTLDYGIITTVIAEYNMEGIPSNIWRCIHENVKEVLINVLKHSNATYFNLEIIVINKIIRVEYTNDGAKGEMIKKGIGLLAIEERTSFVNGSSLVMLEDGIFTLSNVFIKSDY